MAVCSAHALLSCQTDDAAQVNVVIKVLGGREVRSD